MRSWPSFQLFRDLTLMKIRRSLNGDNGDVIYLQEPSIYKASRYQLIIEIIIQHQHSFNTSLSQSLNQAFKMQFTTIIATFILAACSVQARHIPTLSGSVALPANGTEPAFPVRDVGELESRAPKHCLAQACECYYKDGSRCALPTNQYGLCDGTCFSPLPVVLTIFNADNISPACPDTNHGADRDHTSCVSVIKFLGRHKC